MWRAPLLLVFFVASGTQALSLRGTGATGGEEPKTYDTSNMACSQCLMGHMKDNFPWCVCMAREMKEGGFTFQCGRPSNSASFYDCVCQGGQADPETGFIGTVCLPLDPKDK